MHVLLGMSYNLTITLVKVNIFLYVLLKVKEIIKKYMHTNVELPSVYVYFLLQILMSVLATIVDVPMIVSIQ